MKKENFYAGAGIILLLAGMSACSSDEPIANNSNDGLITYKVNSANQTRAKNSYCNNNMPQEFNIWAQLSDGTIYINSDRIVKSGDNEYTDATGARMWPAFESLSFYAVADGNFDDGASLSLDSHGQAIVEKYVINDDVNEQLDLMYAVTRGAEQEFYFNGPVNLNFRHALSQICFKATNMNPNVSITVNSITVKNVANKGNYELPIVTTEGNNSSHAEAEETSYYSYGAWKDVEGEVSYIVPFTENNVLEGNSTACLSYSLDVEGDHNSNNWFKNVLNLIPQEGPIEFDIDVTVDNINADGSKTRVADSMRQTVTADVNWKEGNRYVYTFQFPNDWGSAHYLISYSVSTDDFNAAINSNNPTTLPLKATFNGHEAVLMRDAEDGKPGLYVATCNLGASSPYEKGNFFMYGYEEGFTEGDGFDFIYENSLFYNETLENLASAGYFSIDSDNTLHLTPDYDPASHLWGGGWRLPSENELEWLVKENKYTWFGENNSSEIPVGAKIKSYTTGQELFLIAQKTLRGTNQPGEVYYETPKGIKYTTFYLTEDTSAYSYIETDTGNVYYIEYKGIAPQGYTGVGTTANLGCPVRPVIEVYP